MPRRNSNSGYTKKTFTKEVDGTTHEREALSPSDEVQLTYDGWLPKGRKGPTPVSDAARSAAKPSAGSVAPGTSTGTK